MQHSSTILLIILSLSTVFLFNLSSKQQNHQNIIDYQFELFKIKFGKIYQSEEQEIYRKGIFNDNVKKINQNNKNVYNIMIRRRYQDKNNQEEQNNMVKLKITQFTDMKKEEFVELILQMKINDPYNNINQVEFNKSKYLKSQISQLQQKVQLITTSIDWSTKGKVSPVKNQGICGSCYAFSSTGAMQSSLAIFNNINIVLSQQQIIDCSQPFGNHGCSGGSMDNTFNFIKQTGLTLSSKYPYIGRSSKCQLLKGQFKISKFITNIQDCNTLIMSLQSRPVSVSVDASTWSLYSSGVLRICGNNVNHGVLLVGLDDTAWKIKNSWGTNWGENGYIRIAKGNTCGVCTHGLYPVL